MKKNHIILSIVMISTLLVGGCEKVKPTNKDSTNNRALSTIEEVTENKTNSTEDTDSNTIETGITNTDDIKIESQETLKDLSNILDDLDNTLDDINDSTETESLINNSLN